MKNEKIETEYVSIEKGAYDTDDLSNEEVAYFVRRVLTRPIVRQCACGIPNKTKYIPRLRRYGWKIMIVWTEKCVKCKKDVIKHIV